MRSAFWLAQTMREILAYREGHDDLIASLQLDVLLRATMYKYVVGILHSCQSQTTITAVNKSSTLPWP